MTDRELLELAAKAAGIDGSYAKDYKSIATRRDYLGVVMSVWNPLQEDGDALRLAVKLKIQITLFGGFVQAVEGCTVVTEDMRIDDPYTATRRAIVRVAAEIGKGMK